MRSTNRLLAMFLFSALALPAFAAAPKSVLPFIHDDFAAAVELAKQKRVPLFIEAWAPW